MSAYFWIWICGMAVTIWLSVCGLCRLAADPSWIDSVCVVWNAFMAVIALHEARRTARADRLFKAAEFHLEIMREIAWGESSGGMNIFEHHSDQLDAVIAEIRKMEADRVWRYSLRG